jgi:(2Fe-2S) ferredoxin
MAKEFKKPTSVIYVCNGPKCKKKGGKELRKFFNKLIEDQEILGAEVIKTGCTDRCKFAPVVAFQPSNEWCPHVTIEKAQGLFEKHYME